jgi:hypothetical protein
VTALSTPTPNASRWVSPYEASFSAQVVKKK